MCCAAIIPAWNSDDRNSTRTSPHRFSLVLWCFRQVLSALLSTTERVVQEIDSVEYGLTDIQVSSSGVQLVRVCAKRKWNHACFSSCLCRRSSLLLVAGDARRTTILLVRAQTWLWDQDQTTHSQLQPGGATWLAGPQHHCQYQLRCWFPVGSCIMTSLQPSCPHTFVCKDTRYLSVTMIITISKGPTLGFMSDVWRWCWMLSSSQLCSTHHRYRLSAFCHAFFTGCPATSCPSHRRSAQSQDPPASPKHTRSGSFLRRFHI